MQNRSNRGLGKPVWVKAHKARAFDWDPIRRIALGPAAMCAASTGRTHDSTRPICTNIKITLANREPSTHVEWRGGISPPRSPRTVREPLGSYGSRCPTIGVSANGLSLPHGSSRRRLAMGFGWTMQPLWSSPITGPSSLLLAAPPLCSASVLWPSRL